MPYIENPKTKGSGILCAIPQTGTCPINCPDCFFQSGRSYLEPLDQNLPNLPSKEQSLTHIIRINDGNDSNNKRNVVIEAAKQYSNVFFNTSIPKDLASFNSPVVLTVNPGKLTDLVPNTKDIPEPTKNLMFVRVRVNSWNLPAVDKYIEFYTSKNVPVVLTFLGFYQEPIPESHKQNYEFKKRTLNSYYVINQTTYYSIVNKYIDNPLVYTCGKYNTYSCSRCGNCIREYFNTLERCKE